VIVSSRSLGQCGSRNSVQARDRLRECRRDGCLRLAGRVEGASENNAGRGCRGWHPEAVFVKEGQYVRRGTLLGRIAAMIAGEFQRRQPKPMAPARQEPGSAGARDEEKKIASERRQPRARHLRRPSRGSRCSELLSKGTDLQVLLRAGCPRSGVSDANLKAAVRTEELLAAPPLQEIRRGPMQRCSRRRVALELSRNV